jgi:hypothetical protein
LYKQLAASIVKIKLIKEVKTMNPLIPPSMGFDTAKFQDQASENLYAQTLDPSLRGAWQDKNIDTLKDILKEVFAEAAKSNDIEDAKRGLKNFYRRVEVLAEGRVQNIGPLHRTLVQQAIGPAFAAALYSTSSSSSDESPERVG